MKIENIIYNIMDNYMPVRSIDENNKYILDELIKENLANEIVKLTQGYNLKIKGHTRVSRWADIPWIGIGDNRIDSEAMTGVYIAVLFRADGNEVFLSIQHGTDKLRVDEIKSRVSMLRSNKYLKSERFSSNDLKIKQEESELGFKLSQRAGRYEIANILGKSYSRDSIKDISSDLLELVEIYTKWVERGIKLYDEENIIYIKEDETIYEILKDKKDYTENTIFQVQRDPKQGDIALRKSMYKCEINELHETFANDNGEVYLEKHHLIPMEYYDEFDNSIDNYINIYSLCPLCHKKIHYGSKADRFKMVEDLYNRRKELYQKYYYIDLDKLKLYYK